MIKLSKRHRSPARAIARYFALTAVLVALPACGDGQPQWCEELDSLGDLGGLAAALAAIDGPAADDEVTEFREVAAGAPEEIADDMQAIAETLAEVVDIALSGDDTDADALELRRKAANEELADMPEHIAEVTGWAEEECGIRLD